MNRRDIFLKLIAFVACACISVLVSCGKQSSGLIVNPVYDSNLSPEEVVMAKKAFSIFCKTCQPLMGEYAGDIERIEITRGFDRLNNKDLPDNGCIDYRCREYGWDKQIYVQVKIKDGTDLIPTETGAFGHTLHFYLGGPKNPGFTTSKFPRLCGIPSDETDAFMSVPSLSFVKK